MLLFLKNKYTLAYTVL